MNITSGDLLEVQKSTRHVLGIEHGPPVLRRSAAPVVLGPLDGALGAAPGIGFLEEQVRQNLVLFDRAMKMFSPFGFVRPEDTPAGAAGAVVGAEAPKPETDTSLDDLKQRIEEMQAQIAKLAAKP